jgi:Cu-processing system ATP-binding protein
MPAITIEEVTKRYRDLCALDGVSLSVEEGETFGLLGTNGAGKTTLFRLLAGHDRPDEGSIRVAGLSPDAGARLRRRVGYLPEHAGFQPSLTGREVLDFHARMRGLPGEDRSHRVRRVLATVGLAEAADRRVGDYSNGMNRRLGLATVLLRRPDVLLLDEPTAGLDPRGVSEFHAIVEGIQSGTDVTVALSTHDLDEVERLCDRAAILEAGELRALGGVDDLRWGAGDSVTVTATLADDGTEAGRTLRDRIPAAGVVLDDETVTVECPREEAMPVLSVLHETATVERFEVSEPDLGAAFHEALDGDPSRETATPGGDRP